MNVTFLATPIKHLDNGTPFGETCRVMVDGEMIFSVNAVDKWSCKHVDVVILPPNNGAPIMVGIPTYSFAENILPLAEAICANRPPVLTNPIVPGPGTMPGPVPIGGTPVEYTETHNLTFVKPSKRSLRDDVISGNFTALFASILNKSMTVRGWDLTTAIQGDEEGATFYVREESAEEGFNYTYRAYAVVTFKRADGAKPNPNELDSFLRTLHGRAGQAAFGSWTLACLDGKPYEVPEDDDISRNINADMIGYVDVSIPENWEAYFDHLFGLDAQIAIVRAAIEAGIASNFNNRFHVALAGKPGCGKSDICRSLQAALGEEAVMEYDATAMTGAGAIKDLSEREILPRVLVIEEIEKADEKSLQFLLGLMDTRGEIRKTTARTHIQRDTKLLVIATVNNYEKFKTMNAGALESRFSNKVGFKRPARDLLARILTREVGKINGNDAWITPVLDYADDHGISDPRQVISLCLCGRDGWLDGSYAKTLAATMIDEAELA
jgi:hypothetical protein